MISHATAALSYPAPGLSQQKGLSPAKAAEKVRIEARLAELEKKIDKEKTTGLDPAETDQKNRLQARDGEVRAHEMTHIAAAGGLVKGGMSLVYQTGPDGRSYAIGGSVQIDTSKGATPEETIQKAQRMRSAALAPSDPSPADLQVAARASQLESQARAEITKQQQSSSEQPEVANSKQAATQNPVATPSSSSDANSGQSDSNEEKPSSFYQRIAQSYQQSESDPQSGNANSLNAKR